MSEPGLASEILDRILIPRPNGSENLERVANFLGDTLADNGALVSEQLFRATPYGFQLMWLFSLLMMVLYGYCLWRQRYGLAALLPVALAGLLLLEFEYQVSTVSALLPAIERNVIGTFLGETDGPVLVFAAHYDTATHFGDHFSWGRWGQLQGPATGLAIGFALLAFWLKRRGKTIHRGVILAVIPFTALPFVMMFWFQSIGPIIRTPSIGAIDNGGSVAALLMLAKKLEHRPAGARTTVKVVFLAAEEERTLGSKAYAKSLKQELGERPLKIINLESIGTTDRLAYIPEDGFATRRYTSSGTMIEFVNRAAQTIYGQDMEAKALPFGTLTDGRSFLAEGMEAITLRSYEGDQFPRNLHSEHDSRDRLSEVGIETSVNLMMEMIQMMDR